MSKPKKTGKSTKKTRLTIPVVNLDKLFGPREEEMNESTTETKTKLEKKREELEALEVDADILELEDKIRRKRNGESAPETQQDTLGDKMMEKVIIPLVNRTLAGDDKPRDADSTVDRALRIAEKAVSRGTTKNGAGKNAMDEFDQGIQIFEKIKDLIEGEKAEKEEAGEATKNEKDSLAEIDRTLDLVQKLRDTFPSDGGGGGTSDSMIEFKKWEKEFDLKHKKADREERLDRRRIDKAHDIELGKLGIEQDRNDLLRDGFKRVGRAIALGLGEEDEFEEAIEAEYKVLDETPAKGRGQLIKEKCTECGAEILIPPEAQVAGKEIKCSKCNSVFVWE